MKLLSSIWIRLFRSTAAVLLGFFAVWGDGSAAHAQTEEARVKAAFVMNFPLFVEWPPESPASQRDPFVVCVLGKNPFGETLGAMSRRTVRERPVQVRDIREPEESGGCQLLFIASSEKRRIGWILSQLKSRSVLTVSDMERFVHSGGMIGLVPVNGKIRFEINQKAARDAQLRLSSHLLKLARDVIE